MTDNHTQNTSAADLLARLRAAVEDEGPTAVAARAGLAERTVYRLLALPSLDRLHRRTRKGLQEALAQ